MSDKTEPHWTEYLSTRAKERLRLYLAVKCNFEELPTKELVRKEIEEGRLTRQSANKGWLVGYGKVCEMEICRLIGITPPVQFTPKPGWLFNPFTGEKLSPSTQP